MEEKVVNTDELWDYGYLYSLLDNEARIAWDDYVDQNDLEYEAASYLISRYRVVTVDELSDLIKLFVIPEKFNL